MEPSDVRERGHVGIGQYEVTQVRVPKLLIESKVGNMMGWTEVSRSNARTPLPESSFIEFYLREEILSTPVDPCMGYQRASSEGTNPQDRFESFRNLVDDDVGDLLREGCSHERSGSRCLSGFNHTEGRGRAWAKE